MHDYQNRWLAGGAVRKSNKTKGEFCEEARIAVRKRLKTKEGDFEGSGFFGRQWSPQRAQPGGQIGSRGAETGAGFDVARHRQRSAAGVGRQKRETERTEEPKSCESITQNEFPCQLIN